MTDSDSTRGLPPDALRPCIGCGAYVPIYYVADDYRDGDGRVAWHPPRFVAFHHAGCDLAALMAAALNDGAE